MLGLTWGAAGPEIATRWQTLHILLERPAATSSEPQGWLEQTREKESGGGGGGSSRRYQGTTFTAGQGQSGSSSESEGVSHWLSKGPFMRCFPVYLSSEARESSQVPGCLGPGESGREGRRPRGAGQKDVTTPGRQRQPAAPEEAVCQVYPVMHLRQEDDTV